MREIGIAVVGYGMGAFHCKQIKEVDGLRLHAVCDIDQSKRTSAEAEQKVKVYSSFDETLDDPGVDLVVIATPHHTHAALTIQALSSGKHVVVEKVMCLNLKEADAMIKASLEAKRSLTVHQSRRYDSDYLTARQVIQSGALGEIYQIETACNYYGSQVSWRAKACYGGGFLYDAGAHLIDQLVQIAGCRAKTVFADLQRRIWTDTMDTETYAHVIIHFESGLVGMLDISGIAHYRKPRFLIMGEKGTFVAIADENFGNAECFIYKNVSDSSERIAVEPQKRDWLQFYHGLANHLLRGSELPVKPEEVRESIKIIESTFSSAETGQSVDILNW